MGSRPDKPTAGWAKTKKTSKRLAGSLRINGKPARKPRNEAQPDQPG
jgi:hypothetical protein